MRKKLVSILNAQKSTLFLLLLLMIIQPTISSVLNFWLRIIFDNSFAGADKAPILRLFTIGFLLWLLNRLLYFISSVIRSQFRNTVRKQLKNEIYENILNSNISNMVDISTSGEYISMLTNDINIIEIKFLNEILRLTSSILSIAVLGSSFIILNRKIALAILGYGLIVFFIPLLFAKELSAKQSIYSQKLSHFTDELKEVFVGFPTIKNYSVEARILNRLSRRNKEVEESKFESDYTLALANNIGSLSAWFMQFIAIGFGLLLVIKGEVLVGTVIAARSFATDLADPLQQIIASINSVRSVKDIMEKPDILTERIAIENQEEIYTNLAYGTSDFDIEYKEFSLVVDNHLIVDNFTYVFESGKKYLVVGANGSGKSSIFKALKKWFNEYSGSIKIGDYPLKGIPNARLSQIISYLNEDVHLFRGTVDDNICLYEDVNQQDLIQAKESSKFFGSGQRKIENEGRNFSSGEQRKIEIARSLLNSVKIIIFDEVISTLDIETAYEIEKLALNLGNKTVIFISHNFSGKLLKEYDEILVLKEGKLYDHGTYDALISRNAYFKKLCEIKFGI